MVVQQRIPLTYYIRYSWSDIWIPQKRPQTLQTPAKEVVGMMRLQGPVLQGTIRFEYTFRISLYFSFKMIEKKYQHTTPKRILNLKHTHRTSHNKKSPCYCWCFNLCNLHQSSLFSGAFTTIIQSTNCVSDKVISSNFCIVRENTKP